MRLPQTGGCGRSLPMAVKRDPPFPVSQRSQGLLPLGFP